MKNKIGKWLLRLGIRWTGHQVYTVPVRLAVTPLEEADLTKCTCGHVMDDHLPDPDGHGTICLSCVAIMRHRPEAANVLEASIVGDYYD